MIFAAKILHTEINQHITDPSLKGIQMHLCFFKEDEY